MIAALITGVLTGAGVGGGTLLVLYLTAFAQVEQGQAQGINLLYFLICALPALVSHFRARLVEVRGGLIAAASGAAAAFFSARLSLGVSESFLKTGFGILLLAVGVKELFAKPRDDEEE